MFTIVTGTGYTGRRVLELLSPASATGLSRSLPDSDWPIHVCDLDSATTLPIELPSSYAVLYTIPPKGDRPDRRLSLFLSMLNPTPRRFVYISTTGVYGDYGGKTVMESSPAKPSNERSARRLAAEELLADWANGCNGELTILRAPGIYGPGRLGVERIRSREPVLSEDSAYPGNRIHVDDLARCCVAALSGHAPAGVYNVGDNDHRSSTWFALEVARQSGLPAPPEIGREAAARQFSAQRMSFLSDSRRVDTTKMHETLGVSPRYANAEEGIAASLAQERHRA